MKRYDLTATALMTPPHPLLATQDLTVTYQSGAVGVTGASLGFASHAITALIGASGSGKSSFLRSLNRLNDKVATVTGRIDFAGVDLNAATTNVYAVRERIGMVFQQPNPFAMSIRANLTFALRARGEHDRGRLAEAVERSLREAALWDEVKDVLDGSALALSGGQQQRLCIARAVAVRPEVLLLDEPASALDPVATAKIEATLRDLARDYTIIIVTHNMEQAARISDHTAFFHLGHVLEYAPTQQLFQAPQLAITNDYLTGHFG